MKQSSTCIRSACMIIGSLILIPAAAFSSVSDTNRIPNSIIGFDTGSTGSPIVIADTVPVFNLFIDTNFSYDGFISIDTSVINPDTSTSIDTIVVIPDTTVGTDTVVIGPINPDSTWSYYDSAWNFGDYTQFARDSVILDSGWYTGSYVIDTVLVRAPSGDSSVFTIIDSSNGMSWSFTSPDSTAKGLYGESVLIRTAANSNEVFLLSLDGSGIVARAVPAKTSATVSGAGSSFTPFTHSLKGTRLSFTLPREGVYNFALTGVNGRTLAEYSVTSTLSRQQLDLCGADLASGFYMMRILGLGFSKVIPLNIVR